MLLEGQVVERRRRLTSAHPRVRFRLATDEGIAASIRRGDARAFEALYDRHAAELLSFCAYMLTSRADAEDALQATFAAAYRALRGEERPITLRPWLFAIARNQCLTTLRRRRPTVELDGEPARHGDPARELELREEVRDTLVRLCELPERQRAAMVLSELRGFSQAEIGSVLGVRAEQVKALVYQARADLISERRAREADCGEIREEIASARGAALLRGRLRRHMRSCEDCRTFAAGVARERRQLNSWLPFAPSLLLKLRTLEDALAGGLSEPTAYAGGATLSAGVAAAGLGLAGGGVKAIALKVMAGAAMLGLSTSVGASVAPSHSITRLANQITNVNTTAGGHGGHGSGAGAGVSSSAALGGHGGGSGGGGGALGASALGASGGAAEGRGISERGASDASHSSAAGAGKPPGNGGSAPGHSRGRGGGAVSSVNNPQQVKREKRAQSRESREHQRSERQQQRGEHQGSREHHGHSSEGGQGAGSERQRAAEERRHEAEQRQREQEKSKRLGERQRGAAQRLREREKGKREHEREHSSAEHARQHERQQRQHESQRERRQREREHRSPRRRRPVEVPAETVE